MRTRSEILGNSRVKAHEKIFGIDACDFRSRTGVLCCIFSTDDNGYEHVSVSPKGSKRESDQPCPTWEQMCEVKKAFWRDDEMVVQVHPTEDKYLHGPMFDTNILHLWRPSDGDWSRLEEVMDA